MTRISKQAQRRSVSPRRCRRIPPLKTGPKKDALDLGYRTWENAIPSESAQTRFFPKLSSVKRKST